MNTAFFARWIGGGLLALAMAAEGDTKTQVRMVDTVKVRKPDETVKVTTEVHETQVRTTGDNGRWQTTTAGTQSKTTETTDWKGSWEENTWEGGGGIKNDTKVKVQTRLGNSTAKTIGKTRLEEPETILEGEVGPSYRNTVKGNLGTATINASAGAEGSVRVGENGYEARGQIGLGADVRAATKKFAVGDKEAGASLKGSGRLEVSLMAKGKAGAYVDEKGITFGAEGSAGLYAKGELKLSMEAHVFGVKTNVNLIASGYAGALAEGKAVVTLGWNGKVSFVASLGASLGLGGGVAVEFEMDAEELMQKLNFTDLSQLLDWIKEFQENPMPVLAKLGIQAFRKLHESGFGAIKKLGTGAATVFEHQVMKPIQQAGASLKSGVGKGLAFLGRLIHAPRGEAGTAAVNVCLDQVERSALEIAQKPLPHASMEFAVCSSEGVAEMSDLSGWDGFDPYAWYPFDWPSSYDWPSL
jgi:hypothetical protein